MRILSVRFKSSLALKDLRAPWLEVAPEIAAVPGLLSKIWINDGELFGGLYTFRDQASLDAYAAGPIVASIVGNPAFSDFRLEQYDVLEEHSAITRGLPVAVSR